MQSARWFLKLAPDDSKPYNALTMIAGLHLFSPNTVPSVVCTFSEHGAVRHAFCISDVFTTMIAVLPLLSPNLVPSVVCTFSEHGAVRYAFCISDVFTSRSFNAAKS